MKPFRSTIIFFLLRAFIQSVSAKDIVPIDNFGNNPGNLKMFLHTSKDLKTSEAAPLVIVLHGCMQKAYRIGLETGWNKIADTSGFNVVYAQQKTSNNPTRCFNWFSKTDNVKDEGEIASIKSMIDFMTKNYNTDTNRIFIYGVSAGGAMSAAMMACYPYLFKAGCVVAGGPYIKGADLSAAKEAMVNPIKLPPEGWGAFVKAQNPDYTGSYPKLIVIHGAKDNVVNIENAWNLIRQWTWLHNIDTLPNDKDDDFPEYSDMERKVFKNKSGEAMVKFYQFNKLGHQLPVCPGNEKDKGGQIDMFAVKSELHSTYQVALDFGLVE